MESHRAKYNANTCFYLKITKTKTTSMTFLTFDSVSLSIINATPYTISSFHLIVNNISKFYAISLHFKISIKNFSFFHKRSISSTFAFCINSTCNNVIRQTDRQNTYVDKDIDNNAAATKRTA